MIISWVVLGLCEMSCRSIQMTDGCRLRSLSSLRGHAQMRMAADARIAADERTARNRP